MTIRERLRASLRAGDLLESDLCDRYGWDAATFGAAQRVGLPGPEYWTGVPGEATADGNSCRFGVFRLSRAGEWRAALGRVTPADGWPRSIIGAADGLVPVSDVRAALGWDDVQYGLAVSALNFPRTAVATRSTVDGTAQVRVVREYDLEHWLDAIGTVAGQAVAA